MQANQKKKLFVVVLEIVIAAVFILLAKIRQPVFRAFYLSYFADVVIPFSFYFLLSLNEHKFSPLTNPWIKAACVFSLCTVSEILQFFGIYALARVFDPLDIIAYGVGVMLAVVVDRCIFSKNLSYWDIKPIQE